MTRNRWPVRMEPTIPTLTDDGGLTIDLQPPAVAPAPVVEGTVTLGQRLILAKPAWWLFDLRGASSPYRDDAGRLVVDVAYEAEWYRVGKDGRRAKTQTIPARMLYVERPRVEVTG